MSKPPSKKPTTPKPTPTPTPPPSLPDMSFEPARTVQDGWSQPIFIVEFEGRYYLTKVVWPYDETVATTLGGPKKAAFDLVKSTFVAGAKLQAVNVPELTVRGITNGFTGGR